jgi:hypothetical protein
MIMFPAMMVGGHLLIAVADRVPDLNFEPICRQAAEENPEITNDFETCSRDERAARAQLSREWGVSESTDRSRCVRLSSSNGGASYVEVLTCLEMNRDAKKLRRPMDAAATNLLSPEPTTELPYEEAAPPRERNSPPMGNLRPSPPPTAAAASDQQGASAPDTLPAFCLPGLRDILPACQGMDQDAKKPGLTTNAANEMPALQPAPTRAQVSPPMRNARPSPPPDPAPVSIASAASQGASSPDVPAYCLPGLRDLLPSCAEMDRDPKMMTADTAPDLRAQQTMPAHEKANPPMRSVRASPDPAPAPTPVSIASAGSQGASSPDVPSYCLPGLRDLLPSCPEMDRDAKMMTTDTAPDLRAQQPVPGRDKAAPPMRSVRASPDPAPAPVSIAPAGSQGASSPDLPSYCLPGLRDLLPSCPEMDRDAKTMTADTAPDLRPQQPAPAREKASPPIRSVRASTPPPDPAPASIAPAGSQGASSPDGPAYCLPGLRDILPGCS